MTPDPTPGDYQALSGHPDVIAFAAAEGLDQHRVSCTWRYLGNRSMRLQIFELDQDGQVQINPERPDEVLTREHLHQATTPIPPAIFGLWLWEQDPSTEGTA